MTASALVEIAAARGLMIATAESCTGGLIGAAITDVAGSSAVFDRGFVTYSNAAKMAMLGVRKATLEAYGAVSEEVAAEMAAGALLNSEADIAVSVTGIAGPGGGSADKPVGLVCFGLAGGGATRTRTRHYGDIGRGAVRRRTVADALDDLLEMAQALSARTP